MGRLERIERRINEVDSKVDDKAKKKNLSFTKKIQRLGKKADKQEYVLVQYLTQKQKVLFIVCKVVSGNIIVVNNKVHRLNPKKIWVYKKQIWYIIREIDREPVSNENVELIRKLGRSTDEDVPLIKAVLGAVQKKPLGENKNLWIIIGIAVVAAIVLFMFMG